MDKSCSSKPHKSMQRHCIIQKYVILSLTLSFFLYFLKIFGFRWARIFTQFSSVPESCQTLCDPMNCSMPGLSITNSQSSLKLMSIESVMPSSHLILCGPLFLLTSIFPSISTFPVSQFFASGGQSIGASVSASVLFPIP